MYVLDQPDNLVEMFERTVDKFGDNKWLGTKSKVSNKYDWITYKQASIRIDNFRAGLFSLGITRDDAVGIISNNRVEWAIACYATYGLGARFVPMYEAEFEKIWKYIIRDANISVLLISKIEIQNKISHWLEDIEVLKKVILIDSCDYGSMSDIEKKGLDNPVPAIHPNHEEIAGLLYTSGTTGDPKGVLLSHGNFTSNIHAAGKMYSELDENTSTLSFLPWAHAYGQTAELHFIMSIGGSSGIAERTQTILDDLALVKPLFLVAVPRVFNTIYDKIYSGVNKKGGLTKFLFNIGINAISKRKKLLKDKRKSFINDLKLKIVNALIFRKIREIFGGKLICSLSASAALNPSITEFFGDVGIPVYEAWGMTELSPAGTMNSPNNYKLGSVGLPLDQVSLVIDKTVGGDNPKEGELIVYGPNIMKGYHNKPRETDDVMTDDGGLRTGDKAYIDEDGFLFITGRIKEEFKLENGKFVHPVIMEEEIKLLHSVDQAILFGLNKSYTVCLISPNFLVAKHWVSKHNLTFDINHIINSKKFSDYMLEEIRNHLKGKFATYEIPKKIILINDDFSIENGMLTQTLKLKRQNILKKYINHINRAYET